MTPCWDDQPCHFPLEVSRHRAGVFCHSFANVKTYLPSNLIHLTSQIFIDFLDPFRPRTAGTTRGHRLAALEPPRPLQSPLLQTLDGRFLRLLGRGSDKMPGMCRMCWNYLLVGCVCVCVSEYLVTMILSVM